METIKSQYSLSPTQQNTHYDKKRLETLYNPITQKFNNDLENHVQREEKGRRIDGINTGRDQQLRWEQTYNVLNFKDKLSAMESARNYPTKDLVKKHRPYVNTTSANFNILSNKLHSKHHYLPPNRRSADTDSQGTMQFSPTRLIKPQVEKRDFNILSNRYFDQHDEKTKQNNLFYKQQSAHKYWERCGFNPLKVAFADPEKEEDFLQRRKEEAENHGKDRIDKLPLTYQNSESAIYQPINGRAVDTKRLADLDRKKKAAKSRYDVRQQLETFYHEQGIEEEERKKLWAHNRQKFNYYKEPMARGYDIVNLKGFEGKDSIKPHQPQVKPDPTTWERVVANASPVVSPLKS